MRLSVLILAGYLSVASITNAETKYIDDAKFLKSLTENVTKLKDDGKLKASKDLLAAYKGGKAQVELSKPASTKMDQSTMYDSLNKKVLVHCNSFKCGKCSKLHVSCSTTYAIAKDVIVFNAHAINSTNEEYQAVSDSEGHVFPITKVLAIDKDDDIVIAKVANASFEPFAITPDEPVGSPVVVISNPDNMFYVMTQGNISRYYSYICDCGGKKCKRGRGSWMSITADYAKGSSGAPILSMNGSVVGMVSSTRSIYYNEDEGKHDNLQMVIKSCVPSSFILKLIDNKAK